MKILVTGMAGFIGHALASRLAQDTGCNVVGVDNLNDYYDPDLKRARLNNLTGLPNVKFVRLDLADTAATEQFFTEHANFDYVVHLAAQAGVRYSIDHPHSYAQANLVGWLNVLEGCRRQRVGHLVYASSSSVYGSGATVPFSVDQRVDEPLSLYAATKKANEVMAYSYSHLYDLPTTGLRFFTVYGPWGWPDMALFRFTRNILAGRPIELYNHGDMSRDFTYIDDVVESIVRLLPLAPRADANNPVNPAPHAIFNIGCGKPISLHEFVQAIEKASGKTALCTYKPMQAGDMQHTWANCDPLFAATGYRPKILATQGVAHFVEWYRHYFNIADASLSPTLQ